MFQCVADIQEIYRGSTHSLVCLIYIYSMTNFDVGLDSHTALRPRTSGHGVTGRFDGTGVPKNMFSSEPLGPVSLPGPLPMLKSGTATRCGNCNTLRDTVIHCNTMQHSTTHCSTLQRIAAHCSTVHYIPCNIAAHCSIRKRTARCRASALAQIRFDTRMYLKRTPQHIGTYYNTLQNPAAHCNAQQHTENRFRYYNFSEMFFHQESAH